MNQDLDRVGEGSDEKDAERWNQRYAERTHEHGSGPAAFLQKHVGTLGSGRALVLAMGTGRNAVFLAQRGFEVTGVDISPVGIERAHQLASEREVELQTVEADLCEWHLGEGAWDLITQFYYLERSLFPKIGAALKPGGHFILEHFSTDHPLVADFGPRNPDYLLSPDELPQLLHASGLRLRLYQDSVVELKEGGHKGKAALVRAIAEKPLKGHSRV